MSSKIKSPNEKSHGFLLTLIAVVVIIVAVIAYIVVNGNKEHEDAMKAKLEQVSMKISTKDDFIQLTGLNPEKDAKHVDLYEDYSCPHCADLAEHTDASMKNQIEANKLIVNIHPLNFLDKNAEGHSTLAGTAAETVAEQGDATIYWNYRKMLFDKQRDIYSKWTLADFAKAAKDMGADSSTVEKIKDGSIEDTYKKEAEANSKKLKAEIGRVSSPQIVYEGVSLPLGNDAGDDFADWPQKLVDGGYAKAVEQLKAQKAQQAANPSAAPQEAPVETKTPATTAVKTK